MKIEKEMELYKVSHNMDNILVIGSYTILKKNLDYITLTAYSINNENINSEADEEDIISPNLYDTKIGTLEYKALVGKPSIAINDINAYIPLTNVFEQIIEGTKEDENESNDSIVADNESND